MNEVSSVSVALSWPPKELSPNYRGHWARVAKAKKVARQEAYISFLEAGARNLDWEGARLAVTFHPPGRYGYDEDGLMSRCKAIFDGIADAIGVNDRNFRYPEPTIAEPVKGGKVIIALSPAEKR